MNIMKIKKVTIKNLKEIKNISKKFNFELNRDWKGLIYSDNSEMFILLDKDDNKFLELAVTADASYLITGNKNHFTISEYGSIKIVSPKEYWEVYRNK